MTGMDSNYVVDLSHNPNLTDSVVLYQWLNIDSQKFYFKHMGGNRFRIFNARTDGALKAIKPESSYMGKVKTTQI